MHAWLVMLLQLNGKAYFKHKNILTYILYPIYIDKICIGYISITASPVVTHYERQLHDRQLHDRQLHDRQLHDRQYYDRQLHGRQFYVRQLHDRQFYVRQIHDRQYYDRRNYG